MSSPIEVDAPAGKRPWTLRSELLASHVGLAFFSMLAFGGLLFAMSVHATYSRAEADLLAAAQELVQELKSGTAPADLAISDLYRHRFGMAPRDHAYFMLWDVAGQRLVATAGAPGQAEPSAKLPPDHGPRPFLTRTSGRNLDLIVATPDGGQLLIGRPLAKEWDALEWLLLRILGLGALCLAGGCLVAGWLAKRLSRPLAQLTTTAQQVTSRRLDQRLPPVSGSWEVNQLGQMFDQMLGRLQVAFDKQTRFIADASHELRTPVSVVLSQCEHALYRQRTPEEYRQALEVCLRSSRRMKRLIDDLLFLARADAGRLVLRPVEMNLATAVAHYVELLGPLAVELGVELKTELLPAQLLGDPDRLGQVITNLVVNAIRYNRPGGQVVVHTGCQDQSVLLQVRDNGIGIPPEDQARLFQRFYRADTARTQDDDTGTGLGLSLVYEIVTAHGGTIDVQSAPSEGTTVRVRLPAEAPIFSQSLPETERLPK